jgi:hypothetical protein
MPFRESALARSVFAVVAGVLAFTTALVLAYGRHGPTLLLTERGMAAPTSGFYPIERADGVLFVWTAPHASITLPQIDRRFAWRLHTGVHCWCPDAITPTVRVAVDGVTVLTENITERVDALDVRIPPHFNRSGATLTLDTDPPFVPGPADPRSLGVALDGTTVIPAQHPQPPQSALLWGAAALLVLGSGVALARLPGLVAAVMVAGAALATAGAFLYGFAAHNSFPFDTFRLAVAVSLGASATGVAVSRGRPSTLSTPARMAIVLSALTCYVKLLLLLHPAAPAGEGVFHAQRFEHVLGGRFYFTSSAPGDYWFPYPVLLYLVSAPFSVLAHDTLQRMDLLRIVVTIADSIAGGLLYVMIVRLTMNRAAGVMAVAWYHVIPMTAWIMTWGNLTNAFGQSLFIATLAAAVVLPMTSSRPSLIAVSVLAAGALLSHPSTCVILLAALAVTSAVFWWRGGAVRASGIALATAGAAAVIVAVAVYYAWFPSVYARELTRIAARSGAGIATATLDPAIGTRIRQVPQLTLDYLGWPALIMAAVGIWRMAAEQVDRTLKDLIAAWSASCIAVLLLGLVTPVQMRALLALFPAIAIAAGFGSAWAWRRSATARASVIAVGAFALWLGVSQWMALFG